MTDAKIDAPNVTCEACDAGYRLGENHIHYDDSNVGWKWGVCRKYVEAVRRERAAAERGPQSAGE